LFQSDASDGTDGDAVANDFTNFGPLAGATRFWERPAGSTAPGAWSMPGRASAEGQRIMCGISIVQLPSCRWNGYP
jgi:hypothetical protein